MKKSIDSLIPRQQRGSESNTESSVIADSVEDAKVLFSRAMERLKDVNNWGNIVKGMTSSFQLTDQNGKPVERTVQKGDFFKIDVPGPGPVSGGGYDWVSIEAIEDQSNTDAEEEYFAMKVRPASAPINDETEVAHFFDDVATSSFVVSRNQNTVIAGVYGRNEIPNINIDKTVDKARNTVMALSAIAGFSKLQWKNLVTALIE